jgi:hypothetical protein
MLRRRRMRCSIHSKVDRYSGQWRGQLGTWAQPLFRSHFSGSSIGPGSTSLQSRTGGFRPFPYAGGRNRHYSWRWVRCCLVKSENRADAAVGSALVVAGRRPSLPGGIDPDCRVGWPNGSRPLRPSPSSIG